MPYLIRVTADSDCRDNGVDWAIGAAVATFKVKKGRFNTWGKSLFRTSYYELTVTLQRAELEAVILALEQTIIKYQTFNPQPRLDAKIFSASPCALRYMKQCVHLCGSDGWLHSNLDLIQKASELDGRVRHLGKLHYIYLPRKVNMSAAGAGNQVMDELEDDTSDDLWDFK